MKFDTKKCNFSKTFRVNEELWAAFAATCKLRKITIPEQMHNLLVEDIRKYNLVQLPEASDV